MLQFLLCLYAAIVSSLARKDNLHPFRWHRAAPTDFSDGKTKGTVILTRLYPLHGLKSSTISFFHRQRLSPIGHFLDGARRLRARKCLQNNHFWVLSNILNSYIFVHININPVTPISLSDGFEIYFCRVVWPVFAALCGSGKCPCERCCGRCCG